LEEDALDVMQVEVEEDESEALIGAQEWGFVSSQK